jgi:hypothetical protein
MKTKVTVLYTREVLGECALKSAVKTLLAHQKEHQSAYRIITAESFLLVTFGDYGVNVIREGEGVLANFQPHQATFLMAVTYDELEIILELYSQWLKV